MISTGNNILTSLQTDSQATLAAGKHKDASIHASAGQITGETNEKSPEVPAEVMSLFVNMIIEMLGLLRPDAPKDSGFSLSMPAMPSYRDSESSGKPIFNDMPPLPDFLSTGLDGGNSSKASIDDMQTSNSETALTLPPLPSFVSPTTGSLSTADLPKAFNPPPIPSLTGGSSDLPSINTPSSSASNVGASDSQQVSNSATANAATGNPAALNTPTSRILRVAPLPSFVSPTTGSLSTADLPKAFNPPPIPSLTGGSSALPHVSAADSALSGNAQSTSSFSQAVSTNVTVTALNSISVPSLGPVGNTPTGGGVSVEPIQNVPNALTPSLVPSLTGGKPLLSSTNTNSSQTNSGLSSSFPSLTGGGLLQASSSPSRPTNFVPSLLGGASVGTSVTPSLNLTVPSLAGNATLAGLSSAEGLSLQGASQLVDSIDAGSGNNTGKPFGNHFK